VARFGGNSKTFLQRDERVKIETKDYGTLIESDFFIALFGNRNSQISALEPAFPALKMKRIKQVHGNRVIHTSPHSIDFSNEADAHYTNEKGLALCIATADCMPIFIYHHEPQWVVSIHAGWRGIENRILIRSIETLVRNGCKLEKLQIFVGPHIQKTSFEVGNDVRDQLLKSFKGDKNSVWEKSSELKSHVNLSEILKFQLAEAGCNLDQTFFEMKDTVTDTEFHSYRRDKEASGRQLSFIALKV
jgi:YfiH family protein